MRRLIAIAACGLVLAPATAALGWGSTNAPVDAVATTFNTHLCLDRVAYRFLQKDPAFNGSLFPELASIEQYEGANVLQSGPGPDAKGASPYSWHWYNPRAPAAQAGAADFATAKYFVPLAFRLKDREQGAAWSAHFLADAHVPYHINGEFADKLRADLKASPKRLILDPRVSGDPAVFGKSMNPVTAAFGPAHSADFTLEANRFVAAAGGDPMLDWFDPWFWNGSTDTASYLSSSHVLYEGMRAPQCPPSPVTEYSAGWTNPPTQFGDPTATLTDAVGAFVRSRASDTAAHASERIDNPGGGEALAAQAIATLWRASFSALRTNAAATWDADSLNDPNRTPTADLGGKLGNTATETAHDVQMRARVVSGQCRVVTSTDAPEVQTKGVLPHGAVNFGRWKLEVQRPGACRVLVEAIGRFDKTPDLQLAWHNISITAPEAAAPPPECNCRPGDTMCLTLCHHDPGQPPGR